MRDVRLLMAPRRRPSRAKGPVIKAFYTSRFRTIQLLWAFPNSTLWVVLPNVSFDMSYAPTQEYCVS